MKLYDRAVLALPFYDDGHRRLAERVEAVADELAQRVAEWEPLGADEMGRRLTRAVGEAGLLVHALDPVAAPDFRAIALIREGLAQVHDLCDFAFATQALGSAPIVHYGSAELRAAVLHDAVAGRRIGSLAISEPEAGSDAAAVALHAERRGDYFVLNGEKTWIANATIADHHLVLVRSGEGPGMLGLTVLYVPRESAGLSVEPIALIAPRAFGRLVFRDCAVPVANAVGKPGLGFQVAMEVLDRYRLTVAAAALGFSRCALAAALVFARTRRIKKAALFDLQATQLKLADAATAIAAAALLVARAAWELDRGLPTSALQSSIAKLYATEAAQRIVDDVVQLHGAAGVVHGSLPERLYRQVRSLRIYEGTSEIQRLIIAGALRRPDA